jgi:hypothetical protein
LETAALDKINRFFDCGLPAEGYRLVSGVERSFVPFAIQSENNVVVIESFALEGCHGSCLR